jgi:hypothetical protein
MGITERWRKHVADQDYSLSVVDSDGDKLLDNAPIRAPTLQSAWEHAIAIAFRACQGSGALPMSISVGSATLSIPKRGLPRVRT